MVGAGENALQAIDAAADAGKHGGFCVPATPRRPRKPRPWPQAKPRVSGTRWTNTLIEGCDQALASAWPDCDRQRGGQAARHSEAESAWSGATRKERRSIVAGRAGEPDDAAAHFSSADAKAGHTGDWCNLVLGQSSGARIRTLQGSGSGGARRHDRSAPFRSCGRVVRHSGTRGDRRRTTSPGRGASRP